MSNQTPHMPEAEAFVIGACIYDQISLGVCAERGVSVDYFYSGKARRAWESVIGLYKNGKVVDIITAEKNGADGDYLDKCMETMTTVAHLEHYIDTLAEFEKYRRIHRAGLEMVEDSGESSLPADEMLSKSIDKLLGNIEIEKMSVEGMHAKHIENRERAKDDGVVGLPVALSSLNQIIASWEAPDNVVIAGKSSNGKTALLLSELLPQALNGHPIGIYSTDMTTFQLYERMASNLARVNNFTFKKKYWTQKGADLIDEAWKTLYKLPIHVCDKSNSTIGDVQFFGTICALKYKCKLFALDFLTQLRFTKEEMRMPTRMIIGQHSAKVKSIGKRYDMTTFLISQIGRYGDKTSDMTPPLPNKESLKESGSIENNADIVIIVGKQPGLPVSLFTYDHYVWDMKANVDKQRNGPTGMVDFSYEPRYHQYMNRAEGENRRMIYNNEKDMKEQKFGKKEEAPVDEDSKPF